MTTTTYKIAIKDEVKGAEIDDMIMEIYVIYNLSIITMGYPPYIGVRNIG